jgi:hypothetical protein
LPSGFADEVVVGVRDPSFSDLPSPEPRSSDSVLVGWVVTVVTALLDEVAEEEPS